MNIRSIVTTFLVLILTACSSGTSDQSVLHTDLPFSEEEMSAPKPPLELSVHDALKMGAERNLDAQLAALEAIASEELISLETLKALPTIDASAKASGRNNVPASSSRSVLEGTQSLEPSVSSERFSRFVSLEANWDLTNMAIALLESKRAGDRAKVSMLRYEKVLSNVSRDVYSAYIRALYAQKMREKTADIKADVKERLAKIETVQKDNDLSKTSAQNKISSFVEQSRQLYNLQNSFDVAEIELKTLLNIPLDQELILSDTNIPSLNQIEQAADLDVRELERKAFENRTEIKEALLNKKMANTATRQELMRTMPGIDLLVSLNRDSNVFLVNDRWVNYSASITQQILQLLNFPARYGAAKNQEVLEEQRYRALVLAVISQVHLSYQSLAFLQESFELDQQQKEISALALQTAQAQSKEGFISREQILSEELSAHLREMQYLQSLHALHQAYVMLGESYGHSIAEVLNVQTAMAQNDTGGSK